MHKLLILALLVTLLLVGGCRDAIGPGANPAGTYDLVSVDGNRLPSPFFDVEIVSGSVTLNLDATYLVTSTIRGADDLGELVTQSSTEAGSYEHIDMILRFTSTGGRETIAAYDGRTIRVDEGGSRLVYQRR